MLLYLCSAAFQLVYIDSLWHTVSPICVLHTPTHTHTHTHTHTRKRAPFFSSFLLTFFYLSLSLSLCVCVCVCVCLSFFALRDTNGLSPSITRGRRGMRCALQHSSRIPGYNYAGFRENFGCESAGRREMKPISFLMPMVPKNPDSSFQSPWHCL